MPWRTNSTDDKFQTFRGTRISVQRVLISVGNESVRYSQFLCTLWNNRWKHVTNVLSKESRRDRKYVGMQLHLLNRSSVCYSLVIVVVDSNLDRYCKKVSWISGASIGAASRKRDSRQVAQTGTRTNRSYIKRRSITKWRFESKSFRRIFWTPAYRPSL